MDAAILLLISKKDKDAEKGVFRDYNYLRSHHYFDTSVVVFHPLICCLRHCLNYIDWTINAYRMPDWPTIYTHK